jgi:hypothetical protein
MSEQRGHKRRRERVEERVDRYAQRVHRWWYSCDGCSTTLHQTHNYVLYGNLCWTCWRLNQLHGELLGVASHERSEGGSLCKMSSLRCRVINW